MVPFERTTKILIVVRPLTKNSNIYKNLLTLLKKDQTARDISCHFHPSYYVIVIHNVRFVSYKYLFSLSLTSLLDTWKPSIQM